MTISLGHTLPPSDSIQKPSLSNLNELALLLNEVFLTQSKLQQSRQQEAQEWLDAFQRHSIESACLTKTQGTHSVISCTLRISLFAVSLFVNDENIRKTIQLSAENVPLFINVVDAKTASQIKLTDSRANVSFSEWQHQSQPLDTNLIQQLHAILQTAFQSYKN